jgi:hypothetical protein
VIQLEQTKQHPTKQAMKARVRRALGPASGFLCEGLRCGGLADGWYFVGGNMEDFKNYRSYCRSCGLRLGDNSKRKILTRAEALQIRKLCDTTQLTHGEIGKAFDVTDTVVQRISKMRVK